MSDQLLSELSPSSIKSELGVFHLRRFWEKCQHRKSGRLAADAGQDEWNTDIQMLAALRLGLEQTLRYVYLASTGFEEFEDWVLGVNNGVLDREKIEEFNYTFTTRVTGSLEEEESSILDTAQLNFWDENGYIIIREAVPRADCEETIELICNHIEVQRENPATWYRPHPARQGIMVQLFQHPVLEKNRKSVKIRRVYEQLWRRKDIWVNADRVGFNPPETTEWKFPGPGLHWDVSLELPIPFGLQGLLYLSDTAADQGAFTLVPGFHHIIESWLKGLPPGSNPRNENIYNLGALPVAANAGDFIIWHQALPHGSSPNRSTLPRFVQYINYAPPDPPIQEKWI